MRHKIHKILVLNWLTQCFIDLSSITAQIKEINHVKREQIT